MLNAKDIAYWRSITGAVEEKVKALYKGRHLKQYDLSVTLPKALKKRVEKIMPYEYEEYDRKVYYDDSDMESKISFAANEDSDEDDEMFGKPKTKKTEEFNESDCSEIERMEAEFPKFDLKLDVPLERKEKEKEVIDNWYSVYICKTRKERVHWPSKIYQMETSLNEKTLDEQAEQLMDASAERFTEWLNSWGTDDSTHISKKQLKDLFSIEGDRKLLSSIQTEPKEVKAIAKAVADKWHLPEMAIELKYENYIKNRLKNIPEKVNTVAFGRTVPYRERPWLPSSKDLDITTVFPEDLLSGEKLFKGIGHLRSTKALVDFYKKRPQLEKPRYLVNTGMFLETEQEATKQNVPLYELLKLKY